MKKETDTFGNIDFLGNAAYTDYQLSTVLGIKKGNLITVFYLKRIADDTKPMVKTLPIYTKTVVTCFYHQRSRG